MNQLEQLPIPLLEWYREHARRLPWRPEPGGTTHGNPYHVWLSEIMLQQTRVAAVLDYFSRFLAAAPTVEDLAALPEDKLMKLWQGLGYYNRARNLQKAAQQIAAQGGVFPQTVEGLLELPGVGEYTAGAVASIAFGIPVPAVDGNLLRVTARLTGDSSDITKQETKRAMAAQLQAVIPRDAAGDFNQAMMDLGATVCLPNGAPLCQQCPAAAFCTAHLEARTTTLPVKAPKKPRRQEERTVFLLFYQGMVALRRRSERGLLAGLWEYPNELGHHAQLPPEWGLAVEEVRHAGAGKHIFTHIEWHMQAQVVHLRSGDLPPGWVWANRAELAETYAVPNAFSAFAHVVAAELTR